MKILITPRSLTRNGHGALDKLEDAGYELVFSTPGAFPSENELIEIPSPEPTIMDLGGSNPTNGRIRSGYTSKIHC